MQPQRHSPTWELIGDVLLSGWIPVEIEPGRWKEYLKMLQDDRIRLALALVQGSVIINAGQRSEAAEALKRRGLEVVVVTDSRFTRGMLTALSWLGAKVKPFSWTDLDKAVEVTGAPPDVRGRLKTRALAFREETKHIGNESDSPSL